MRAEICGIIHHGGRNMEPLACGFPLGHKGEHAWATIPTFTAPNGLTKTEVAAEAVLRNYGEFGYVTDSEWLDALNKALTADKAECKARTDTQVLNG